jgi:predicted AlkP superfamily pyrophosphatase or phosphodiesterase
MILIALLLLLTSAGSAQIAPKERTVIVISLDGFPAYALEDPQLPVPNIRRLIREGAVAKRMITSNPTVTWPNHTSMVTGVHPAQHSVLYNGQLVRTADSTKIEPWADKLELVKSPTVYDLAFQAGLTTAQVDWVAIYGAKTITWQFAEVPNVEGAIEKEMIEAGLVTESDVSGFQKAQITWRDDIWTKAAIHILQKHHPNLLLFHLLNTDSVHHRYGPRSLAGNSALALADARVGEILQAIDGSEMEDRTTIFIVADHGFKIVKKHINPKVLIKDNEALIVPEGGTAMVYINKLDETERLKKMFAALEGVDRIIEPSGFAALGLPTPETNKRMANIVLSAKDGYAFSGSNSGDPIKSVDNGAEGAHGYLNTDPEMNAVFVAWGSGIHAGTKLDTVRNIDIAPTVAELLGLRMSGITGKSLLPSLSH